MSKWNNNKHAVIIVHDIGTVMVMVIEHCCIMKNEIETQDNISYEKRGPLGLLKCSLFYNPFCILTTTTFVDHITIHVSKN